ncbi:hypothetical protein EMCRGX_G007662 [Ephydatia muelleri]
MQWSGNAATDINDRAPPRTAYINIADDEYAEQDFGVEDAADNDEYADKDFENLVKQFRVDEKMCYFHSQGSAALMFIWFILKECGINVPSLRAFIVLGVDMPQRGSSNELHVEIEPVIDKDAFIHITSYPEDVYFPEDCGIILNKLTIRLTQVSHLAQPSSSLLKWDGSKFERLSSQIRAVRPSWEHSTEVLPHLHG